MLAEMARLSSQQRPLYCYLLMSVWIFLLVAGMYKYITTVEMLNIPKQSMLRRDTHYSFRGDNKLKKIISKFCNAPENIEVNSEGLPLDEPWSLQGVITIIRHGDRGPLTHVRDIENVNCDASNPTSLLQRYQEYINNATGSGKAPWAQSPGPFHNFPLLPSAPTTTCHLGQLTLVGIQQLLMTGALLGKVYSTRYGWNIHNNNINQSNVMTEDILNNINKKAEETHISIKTKSNTKEVSKSFKIDSKVNSKTTNTKLDTTSNTKSTSKMPVEGDIVVHSTRYRRALQSALALIWAMLDGSSSVASAVAHESPSLAFCFTDCACPAADNYAKILSRELKDRLETHPAIGELVTQLSKVISQSPSQISSDPHVLEDALLTYLCHAAPLPCVEKPIDISPPVKKSNDNHKQKPITNVKNENKIRNLLKLHENPLRRLLFNFPYEARYKNAYRIQRDVRVRSFDMRPKQAPLDFDSQMEKEKLGYYQQKMLENADSNYQDVILVKRNMDGDFNFNGDGPNVLDVQDTEDSDDYEEKPEDEQKKGKSSNMETLCIRKDHVTGLFAYTDWEMKQSVKSKNLKRVSLLRAYGMIRHIVQYVLRMISENKPKFVLYSGHDKTLQYLSLALGLSPENFLHIQYASRIIIEVYRNVDKEHTISGKFKNHGNSRIVAPLDFYFRLIMNGIDVTNQLSFCKGKNHISVDGHKFENMDRSNKHYLCRIENIIRFTHEDYFTVFNSTNFKDACSVH